MLSIRFLATEARVGGAACAEEAVVVAVAQPSDPDTAHGGSRMDTLIQDLRLVQTHPDYPQVSPDQTPPFRQSLSAQPKDHPRYSPPGGS